MSRRASIRRVLRAALVIPAILAAAVSAAAAADKTVALTVETVPLNLENETQVRAGALLYRGGIAVRSPDPRFGGFSGLAVSRDGAHLTAVSDRGAWLRARIRYDGAGRLAGLAGAGALAVPAANPARLVPSRTPDLCPDGRPWWRSSAGTDFAQ